MTSEAPTTHALRQTVSITLFVGVAFVLAGMLSLNLRVGQEQISNILLAIGAMLAAAPLLVGAASGWLRRENTSSHTLIFLAVLGCFAISDYTTAALVSLILVLGQKLEEGSALGVRDAIRELLKLRKTTARRIIGEYVEEVDCDHIQPEDYLEILPGGLIPVDGEVYSGESTVDQSHITGESALLHVGPGTEVFAGSINTNGLLVVRALRTAGTSVVARIQEMIESAHSTRPRLLRLVEKYSKFYTPAALGAAVLTLMFTGVPERAVAVLISFVPCAFLLSAPTALVSCTAALARLGILVKSPAVLESLADIKTIVFDKTGTLTEGRPQVTLVKSNGDYSETEIFDFAASLASKSTHPVSVAISETAKQLEIKPRAVEVFFEAPGKGLRGRVDEKKILLGRLSWLQENGVNAPTEAEGTDTTVHVAINGDYAGCITVSDKPRAQATKLRNALHKLGVSRLIIATGDKSEVAKSIGEQLEISDVRAGLLPEDKLRVIKEASAYGPVMMVGDGINDAPALAQADVNVAFTSPSSSVATHTAQIVVMNNELDRIPALLKAGYKLRDTINSNLGWGLAFVLLAAVLSAFGLLSPVMAALLHEAGAFWVLINSIKLLKFKPS